MIFVRSVAEIRGILLGNDPLAMELCRANSHRERVNVRLRATKVKRASQNTHRFDLAA